MLVTVAATILLLAAVAEEASLAYDPRVVVSLVQASLAQAAPLEAAPLEAAPV